MDDRKARRAKLRLAGIGVLAGAVLTAGVIGVVVALDDDDEPKAPSAGPTASSAKPSPSGSGKGGLWNPEMTPEKANTLTLSVPTGQKGGASTGFPHNAKGAVSAAVYFWEEYAFLDDQKARQQLEAVVSPDAAGYIDEQISEVRKTRETAGLPPSGPAPAGITFTMNVNAARSTSIIVDGDTPGDVVQVWMDYDRYATGPDGGSDNDPLKGEAQDFIVKWQDGGWKLTNEPKYWKKRSSPVAYAPDSPYATQDGWVQVQHAD
ncbi:hypothetical protein [Streptomyces sp. NPDC093109]|uniref:hypothetical protein n=1 Tax=Streptomyces sp. NPDC093109 TaxID=3154977 RepID=UPI00344F8967